MVCTAQVLTGPWLVATSVPEVIYGIPVSSPLHYVTYVQVYGAGSEVVYVGYTPGYLGTVVASDGVVVYGTGYNYTPWIGSVWYAAPYTWGLAAAPIYNPYAGADGNVYRSTDGGWQQHTSEGWQSAASDTAWADREQQARSSYQSRAGGWDGGDRFGGGGDWGSRFGGGSSFSSGFGGGGFGGGFRGGRR